MRCPRCGTLVRDDLDVCPACHVQLAETPAEVQEGCAWCVSCGSPIPAGNKACPVCGMPVEGAFEDEEDDVAGLSVLYQPEEPEEEGDPTGFISAIPAKPANGEESRERAARSSRMQHLLVAIAASLVFVGGTALAITRPWDPNPYASHATEDADTSLAGFPGEVTHLTSQDFVEDEERKTQDETSSEALDEAYTHMGQLHAEASSLRDVLQRSLDAGIDKSEGAGHERSRALEEELDELVDGVQELYITDAELGRRRQEILLMASYLQGEMTLLEDAWLVYDHTDAPSEKLVAVRSTLAGETSERSYEEWDELFKNAYDYL